MPTKRSVVCTTDAAGAHRAAVRAVLGNDQALDRNTPLASLELPVGRGSTTPAQIRVTVELDVDGRGQLTATDELTGDAHAVPISVPTDGDPDPQAPAESDRDGFRPDVWILPAV